MGPCDPSAVGWAFAGNGCWMSPGKTECREKGRGYRKGELCMGTSIMVETPEAPASARLGKWRQLEKASV